MSTVDPRSPARPISADRRWQLGLAALLAFLTFGVMATAAVGSTIQAGVRAYVGGEGLWSKAEKDAVVHLLRFTADRDPADWAVYEGEIEVTLGDRRARLELEKDKPDDAVVLAGFVAGRNVAEDVPSMSMLFRTFRHLSYIDRSISIWTDADAEIDRLRDVAGRIRAAVDRGDQGAIEGLTAELYDANTRLTALEGAFSQSLGEGARFVQTVLLAVMALILAILIVITATVGRFMLGRLRAADIRSAETLRASESRLRLLVDHLPAIVWTTDRDLKVTSMTGDGVTRFDVDPLALVGRPLPAPFQPGQGADLSGSDEAAVAHRDALRGEPTSYRAVTNERTFQVHVEPLQVDGRIIGTIGLGLDLTERLELEGRLERATRLESIGRLAGGVAHDFNNLLTAITGYADLLAANLPDGNDRRDAEEIQRAAQRAAELTGQLLAFGRRSVLKPEIIQPNLVIADMQNMILRLIGDEITLVIDLDPDLIEVTADPGQLEQVILNLVVNARDAMPSGGILTIATQRTLMAPTPAGGGVERRDGTVDAAEIRVSDTGIGMDAATRARIFEPFFTTKPRGKGTGLGLSTVYGLVDQSGGSIQVDSTPNEGTTFTVVLAGSARERTTPEPAEILSIGRAGVSAEEPAVAAIAFQEPPAVAPGRITHPALATGAPSDSPTILVAEDEGAVRDLVCHVLRGAGYRVEAAVDGRDALGIAERLDRLDGLLTDVMMPLLNGPQLAAALRELRPGLPVLFMSGFTGDVLGERGVIDPGVELLVKPFGPADLVDRVRRLLAAPLELDVVSEVRQVEVA